MHLILLELVSVKEREVIVVLNWLVWVLDEPNLNRFKELSNDHLLFHKPYLKDKQRSFLHLVDSFQ